jgi:hypothetical protein
MKKVILILVLLQIIPSLSKLLQQYNLYNLAKIKSKETNKKLLIIGDPSGGILNKIINFNNCGDICIDMNGCKCPVSIKSKLENILYKYKTGSVVIFESSTFCMIEDIHNIIQECLRISGGDIYSVLPQHSLIYKLIGRHIYKIFGEGVPKWNLLKAPPKDKKFIFEKYK